MTVDELLKHFEDSKKPDVAAAALLGIHPQTIYLWTKKGGEVPPQWAAYFRQQMEAETIK